MKLYNMHTGGIVIVIYAFTSLIQRNMPDVQYVENGNTGAIIVSIVIGGLGFYLALALAEAINTTISAIIPRSDNRLAEVWINMAIALVIVAIIVILIITLYNRKYHLYI